MKKWRVAQGVEKLEVIGGRSGWIRDGRRWGEGGGA